MQAMQQGSMFNMFGSNNMNVNGVPVDYIPDQSYYTRLLASQQDAINEDEEIYSDEVIDYYMHKKNANSGNNGQNITLNSGQMHNKGQGQRQQQQQQQSQRGAGTRANNVTAYSSNNISATNKSLTT